MSDIDTDFWERAARQKEDLIIFADSVCGIGNNRIFSFDNTLDSCVIISLNPEFFLYAYYENGKWNHLPKKCNSIQDAKDYNSIERYLEKYVDYSRDEIDSLYDGILKDKPFCSQYDFIFVDAKRLTKRFHNEKDMFEWVNENAAAIYVLLKERTPDVFSSCFARVLLNEIHTK